MQIMNKSELDFLEVRRTNLKDIVRWTLAAVQRGTSQRMLFSLGIERTSLFENESVFLVHENGK